VKEDVKKIVKLELNVLSERLTGLKYNIKFDDSIIEMISEVGFDEMYGARPIKRAIQDKIEDFISEEVLKSNIQENIEYTLISENGDVKFKDGKKVIRKRKGVE
jgi:ATP-dependent Clp protease ATP-binding subunit ClpA